MADGHKCIILMGFLALLYCDRGVSHTPRQSFDRPPARIATSRAADQLRHARTLTSEDVEKIIADFAAPENQRAFPMEWGLYTGHTPETDVLLEYPELSHDALIRALRDPNIHIRRYSAFTLAEMHHQSDLSPLHDALRHEIAASAPATPDRGMNPAVAAMVRACATLNKRETISWLLGLELSSSDAIASSNEQVCFLLPLAPRCESTQAPQACREVLRTYWKTNHAAPDSNLFP